jgi:hypothetical protein
MEKTEEEGGSRYRCACDFSVFGALEELLYGRSDGGMCNANYGILGFMLCFLHFPL